MTVMSFEDARARLLSLARPVTQREMVDVADAFGRVLAEGLVSPMDVPRFTNSAMDGYAVRAADVPATGTRLPVSLRIAAGDAGAALPPGNAARIFTGAPLPDGADAVVMQEYCSAEGSDVVIGRVPATGEWVRRAGWDLKAGQDFLSAGSRLSAGALGLAASVGIATLPVLRRLKVAIFFTGSELTDPGQPLPPGHIYNANRYIMRGFLQHLGIEVTDLGIIRDDRQATRDALREAAAVADVIVTSGGMSEGDEDHVTAAVKAEGSIAVWKVASKPGKPLAFGNVGQAAFIGLPGNPVSVWAGMLAMVSPFLRASQGLSQVEPLKETLRADFSYTVKGDRLELVRVRKNAGGGLDIFPNQDSSIISSAVWADGVAFLPAGSTIKPGDLIAYLPGPEWNP